MIPSTPIPRFRSPNLLVGLLLMSTLLSCSKPPDDDGPDYGQYLGRYSGSKTITFTDGSPARTASTGERWLHRPKWEN